MWLYLAGLGKVLQRAVCALNPCSIYGAVSPTARVQRPRNTGKEMGAALLTITPSDSLQNVCFLFPGLML